MADDIGEGDLFRLLFRSHGLSFLDYLEGEVREVSRRVNEHAVNYNSGAFGCPDVGIVGCVDMHHSPVRKIHRNIDGNGVAESDRHIASGLDHDSNLAPLKRICRTHDLFAGGAHGRERFDDRRRDLSVPVGRACDGRIARDRHINGGLAVWLHRDLSVRAG